MQNLSNVTTARSKIPVLGSFALAFIGLGVLLYGNGANIPLTLLTTGIGAGLLLWPALLWRSPFRIGLFFLLIFIIVFAPPLPPFFGSANWRIHQLALIVLAPCIIFWRRRIVTRVDALIAFFSLAVVLSMLIGTVSGNPPLMRDWFELAKPGFWWLIYSFGLGLGWRLESKERALWILLAVGIGCILLALAQYSDQGGVNSWLTPVFLSGEAHLSSISYRVVGTFVSPALLSTFMTTVLNVALVAALFSQQQKWLRIILILSVGGAFTVILMTASKSGFLAGILSAVGLMLIHLWSSRGSALAKPLLTSLLVAVIAGTGIFMVARSDRIGTEMTPQQALLSGNPLTATLYRFSYIAEDLDPDSIRLTDWRTAWELGREAPIFGVGPSKGIDERTYFHSEYLLVFRRYGLVGLSAFLFLYGSIALSAYRSFREAQTRQDAQQQVMALSMLTAVLVFATDGIFSNGATSDFQLSAVLWWMVGLFYGSTRYEKRCLSGGTRSIYG
jgi:hypothetical protein